jgi:NADPH2:quinone reductase
MVPPLFYLLSDAVVQISLVKLGSFRLAGGPYGEQHERYAFRRTIPIAGLTKEKHMNEHIPSTMRAAALDHFGGLETITMHTVPVPQVGPKEVLIRIDSAGVAQWDPFEREGGFVKMFKTQPTFPYVLGSDGAGTVVEVGKQVEGFKEGDLVYAAVLGNPKGGFYAEYASVNAEYVSRIPGNLSTEQAGVTLSDAVTGLRGLDDILNLQPEESVMIFGASGGIGHMAVQLAKRIGARVFAVASGDDGVALAKRLGADAVVDGHKDDVVAAARKFAQEGIDAALLTAGGKSVDRALTSIRKGGRVAYPNGVEPEPKVPSGVKVTSYDGEPDPGIIAKLNRLIEADQFEVHIVRTFPLDRASDAHRALDEHYVGKLALKPH